MISMLPTLFPEYADGGFVTTKTETVTMAGYELTGSMLGPHQPLSSAGRELFYANGRPASSPLITSIVRQQFRHAVGRCLQAQAAGAGQRDVGTCYPGFLLQLTCSPRNVCINAETERTLVTFADHAKVTRLLRELLARTWGSALSPSSADEDAPSACTAAAPAPDPGAAPAQRAYGLQAAAGLQSRRVSLALVTPSDNEPDPVLAMAQASGPSRSPSGAHTPIHTPDGHHVPDGLSMHSLLMLPDERQQQQHVQYLHQEQQQQQQKGRQQVHSSRFTVYGSPIGCTRHGDVDDAAFGFEHDTDGMGDCILGHDQASQRPPGSPLEQTVPGNRRHMSNSCSLQFDSPELPLLSFGPDLQPIERREGAYTRASVGHTSHLQVSALRNHPCKCSPMLIHVPIMLVGTSAALVPAYVHVIHT